MNRWCLVAADAAFGLGVLIPLVRAGEINWLLLGLFFVVLAAIVRE